MTEPAAPEQGMTEEQMIEALVQHQAFLLSHALPRVPPEQLAHAIREELLAQEGLAAVLNDVIDEAARTKNPMWGFRILKPDGGELTRVMAAKLLDPTSRDYIQALATWGNIHAMVTTPALRAAWRAVGGTVEFFQAKAPSPIIRP